MNIEKFVRENLLNKNGKLEGQRLTEKWLNKRGFYDELTFFKNNSINDSRSLYLFLNSGETGICECGMQKRFIGFRDGFKPYCENCSRTKYNWMKSQGNVDISIEQVIDFVKDKNGKYSTSKLNQLSEKTIERIKDRVPYLKSDSIPEFLYHIENGMTGLNLCKNCNKMPTTFISAQDGYLECCSLECSSKYNKDKINANLKKFFYKKFVKKYVSNDEYTIKIFSEYNYINGKECLIEFKHKKCGHEYSYDILYQGHLKCPKCYPVRSKTQYEIYEWLKTYTVCSFNDRRLIAPKELDILTETFAIEYDSQMYHSFGKSSVDWLDNVNIDKNIHLRKTNNVESKGLQLFRIFSTEWELKEKIWKSVILSKLGKTKRIYARNCIIKEIDSKTTNDFLEANHLQGKAKQSVRIGLFHGESLVSVMTFGKSRYNKNYEYELIRFCSEINTTVIGGASKLLKYFERKYSPKSLISYANRRWSQGNLYEKLGFTFLNDTTPNYFYFKGDLGLLHSRVQFQKHKLKDKLEHFDPNLTETENMFNNGYRKIYDCGNKVYVKSY